MSNPGASRTTGSSKDPAAARPRAARALRPPSGRQGRAIRNKHIVRSNGRPSRWRRCGPYSHTAVAGCGLAADSWGRVRPADGDLPVRGTSHNRHLVFDAPASLVPRLVDATRREPWLVLAAMSDGGHVPPPRLYTRRRTRGRDELCIPTWCDTAHTVRVGNTPARRFRQYGRSRGVWVLVACCRGGGERRR